MGHALWSGRSTQSLKTTDMADAAEDAKRKEELNNSLKEYISEWRKTREAEEDELAKLKEKQAKRKEIRAEQEKKLNAAKKEEEEKMKKEEADRKAKEAEEKKKRLEEAEAKRQEMLDAQKAQKADANEKKKSVAGGPGNDARKELSKTKEQLEEKKIALSIRIKPLELEAMDSDEMKTKAEDLFKVIVQLETDKYDYEQRKLTQELDLKELKERQKAQLRAKALKKGLDPEALTGKYPPKIRMYSKYERRTDTRSYDDRKKMYEGGWEVVRAEHLEASWKEKHDEWFGERPGKKAGAPETPEGEEEAEAAAAEEEDYDEEEEEEEEYDEEEE